MFTFLLWHTKLQPLPEVFHRFGIFRPWPLYLHRYNLKHINKHINQNSTNKPFNDVKTILIFLFLPNYSVYVNLCKISILCQQMNNQIVRISCKMIQVSPKLKQIYSSTFVNLEYYLNMYKIFGINDLQMTLYFFPCYILSIYKYIIKCDCLNFPNNTHRFRKLFLNLHLLYL